MVTNVCDNVLITYVNTFFVNMWYYSYQDANTYPLDLSTIPSIIIIIQKSNTRNIILLSLDSNTYFSHDPFKYVLLAIKQLARQLISNKPNIKHELQNHPK